MQLVEAGVAHQMTPATFTEPPVRTVDVQSQRRRSGRTRTGTGFGREPSRRTPAPIPTAVATMVTIQDVTSSTYSLVIRRARRDSSDGKFSVGAAAAAAAAATRARRRRRGRRDSGRGTNRGEHRQETHRTVVSGRTRGRIVGGRHGATLLEGRVAGLAAELVERHGASVGLDHPASPVDGCLWLTGVMSSTETRTRPGVDPSLDQTTETGEPAGPTS